MSNKLSSNINLPFVFVTLGMMLTTLSLTIFYELNTTKYALLILGIVFSLAGIIMSIIGNIKKSIPRNIE